MGAIGDARDAIEAALGNVEGLRVHKIGQDMSPPAAVVGPPRLVPSGGCSGPGNATFPVNVVVAVDKRAPDVVWELTAAAWRAIDDHTDGVVVAADPGTYTAGQSELPSYELQVEYPIET